MGYLDHIPISLSPLGGKSTIPTNIFSRRPSVPDDVVTLDKASVVATGGHIVKASRPKKMPKRRQYNPADGTKGGGLGGGPAALDEAAAKAAAAALTATSLSGNSSVTLDPNIALVDAGQCLAELRHQQNGLVVSSDAESSARKRKLTKGSATSNKRLATSSADNCTPNMTRSERLRLRKLKNRESAARSRQKRLEYQEQLERQRQQLESANEKLFGRLVTLSRGIGEGDGTSSLLKRLPAGGQPLLRRHSM